jgi:hypothetical protein
MSTKRALFLPLEGSMAITKKGNLSIVSVHVVAVRETCSSVSMPRMIEAHEHHTPFPT